MVFLSAIIVSPDLWLSFLARLNPEDQRNKNCPSAFACLAGACFIFTFIYLYLFWRISTVGSGKSTLVSAIAGEILNASGTIDYHGSVIYLPQTAWVFSGTIKENILFGQVYEESKYERIIDVCALKEDFERLPDGDQTVVGERGEVLSGGQQARVSLARAVYADGDVYLLDDPLSTVDVKVGQHIFIKRIIDLLGDKIVLFASHQQQLMENAD